MNVSHWEANTTPFRTYSKMFMIRPASKPPRNTRAKLIFPIGILHERSPEFRNSKGAEGTVGWSLRGGHGTSQGERRAGRGRDVPSAARNLRYRAPTQEPQDRRLRARGTRGGLATTGEGIAFAGALIVCEVLHGAAQQPVGLRLVSGAIGCEPGNDVGVQTHGDGPLCRPMEFSDFGCAPIEDWGSIGEINVAISFCGDSANVPLLRFCELPHRLSFIGRETGNVNTFVRTDRPVNFSAHRLYTDFSITEVLLKFFVGEFFVGGLGS